MPFPEPPLAPVSELPSPPAVAGSSPAVPGRIAGAVDLGGHVAGIRVARGTAGESVGGRIGRRRAEKDDCRGRGPEVRIRTVRDRVRGLAVHDSVRRFTAHACVDS